MKKITLVLAIACAFVACKKEDQPSNEDILNKAVGEIIPAKYLDSLRALGLPINEGTTPPNVEGIYVLSPLILKKTTVPSDFSIGYQFADDKIKLYNQSATNYAIQWIIKGGTGSYASVDTSLATAVSGSGNNFTVYGKTLAKAVSGEIAILAKVISGVKDGNTFKNVKMGLINIDNSKGGNFFIPEGTSRLIYEDDNMSQAVSTFSIDTNLSTGKAGVGAKKN